MPKAPLRLLLLLLCFTASMPAMADALYRCLGARGAVSYQSQACATGQRLDRVVAYQLESVAIQAPKLSRRDPRHPPVINARRHPRTTQTRVQTATANDRCQLAKLKREQALEKLGMRRSYEQLSQEDAGVRRQCRW